MYYGKKHFIILRDLYENNRIITAISKTGIKEFLLLLLNEKYAVKQMFTIETGRTLTQDWTKHLKVWES